MNTPSVIFVLPLASNKQVYFAKLFTSSKCLSNSEPSTGIGMNVSKLQGIESTKESFNSAFDDSVKCKTSAETESISFIIVGSS